MSEGKIFGYGRVSDKSQNEARQLEALLEYGINERDIYIDKMSGKDFNRENYILLKEKLLRKNDVLVIKELDRLGRNYDMIKEEWDYFIKNEISVVILDMSILNTKDKTDLEKRLISDIVLSLLSYLAEKERQKIRQRQAEGIAIAKREGRYKGGKKKDIPNFDVILRQWQEGSISALKACRELNISPPTFYRRLKDIAVKKETKVNLKSKTHEEFDRLAKIIQLEEERK
jgi:DNA invertase Pin-like site-specific DNA recombinase